MRLPQCAKVDLEHCGERLQGLCTRRLPALDALDRPSAEARDLRELFLRPAPLQAQLLDQQGRVVSHGRTLVLASILDHVGTPTRARQRPDFPPTKAKLVRAYV